MDLWKFESLLKNGYHFRRADSFIDPFEGHFAWGTGIKKYIERCNKDGLEYSPSMPGKFYLLMKLQEYERKKKSVYISCWQNSDYESEAMWKLYTGVNNNPKCKALVLKTSIDKLYNVLSPSFKHYKLEVNPVEYLSSYGSEDYSDISTSIFFKKRKCFEYEQEVRAVYSYKRFTNDKENEENAFHNINLNHLIEEIRISPFLGEDFKSEVEQLIAKYNLKSPVYKSEIDIQPEVSIKEELKSIKRTKKHLGDRAFKSMKPIYPDSLEIVERFDDVEKTYIITLRKN
ncbi:MAG: hypothetical protein ACNS60_08110 [Candidatus Cyclobacteriaceae bacterium M2_1C_046]